MYVCGVGHVGMHSCMPSYFLATVMQFIMIDLHIYLLLVVAIGFDILNVTLNRNLQFLSTLISQYNTGQGIPLSP